MRIKNEKKYVDVNEIYKFFNGGNRFAKLHVSDIDTLPAADVVPRKGLLKILFRR